MMAVGWTFIAAQHRVANADWEKWPTRCFLLGFRALLEAAPDARAIHQLALYAGFGHALPVHRGHALHAHRDHRSDGAPRFQLDLNAQLVAWNHGPAESGAV